ncbi:carboxypeptidase-like regulatory domain-containing protein [Myroides pelagicus]|uniref:TonB-dependent receptor n=1 Tax=Myroides pelagicus TaxID=270914 RepID=A0A7K1GIZ6_9FLAO|nr:carboxypeptidase-like regulatory domain-containing protein [Myroides pelagicus]MEC4113666.1 carboxypeptidase-like regulatory domain-containing protein [Myroides pelagicus]MTH28862.1 TonB-dependent receptor [Myroides pelagicus]
MKKLLFSLFLVLQVVVGYAQGVQEIKGKVVDAKSLTPINAVLARVEATNISTLTDNGGIFILRDVKAGNYSVLISYVGYNTKKFPVTIDEDVVDLGTIYLEEDLTSSQMGVITLTENDLGDDDSGSESSSSLLQATKDPFQQAAAFNWGSAFYRMRGLDNEYGKVLINGVVMNKIHDGRPQWGNWGGLNDATRNQEYSSGSTTSDQTFGGVLGTQAISTRASHIRQGAKAGFSLSNNNYSWRPYAIYSSGLNKDGWAYVVSASYRGANEGHWEGTNYDALSFFAAVEKKFNDNHSLNLSAIYAKNKRAKNSPVTDEQTDLKGYKYNSYWGDQAGDKRNSRYKDVAEPIFTLTHYWTINDKSKLTTTLGYQFGHIANSRFGYTDGMNPDPTYYRKMPSYYLNRIDAKYWSMTQDEFNALPDTDSFKIDTQNYLDQAKAVEEDFVNNGQVNWGNIYRSNQGGLSKIILYEDRQDENVFSFNTDFKSTLTDNITFETGLNYRRSTISYYKKLTDLLGGTGYRDIDTYQEADKQDSDMQNPNRLVDVDDKFGYNYKMYADVVDLFTQFKFDYNKFDFYLAQKIGYTRYQREGLYQNAIYAYDSYGKSGAIDFNNFGFKAGMTYHITGRHALDFNAAYYNQAPTIRNTFANARVNNLITKDLTNEDILSVDASYILRTPKFKARVTGYLSEIKNSTQINFYYADGVGIVDANGEYLTTSGGAFVSEILTGVNKRNLGIEFGAEYKISQTVKATAAAAIGQSFYTNNPKIRLNSDNVAKTFDYGTSYLENVKLGNGPQTALSLGLEYRDPAYWWVGANVNYMANAYTNVSALRRTDNFVIDPDTGNPFAGLNEDKLRDILRQEKLADFTLVNITAGKSWRLPNRNIIGAFASLNNVFNKKFKTGGFEQARNANYEREVMNTQSGTNTFANRYWYGYGRNFFVNVYYNF